ncbi:hypothetical protein HU200_066843 [Digitaria exilis]|uniref:Uncharacterized protein n=1 Tax=Digitaria exilis TaxID=1010633 RepID=A0A834ZXJ2_9POAL|nr:hypothetical protein HU200_066843 [Digitaria exilis]
MLSGQEAGGAGERVRASAGAAHGAGGRKSGGEPFNLTDWTPTDGQATEYLLVVALGDETGRLLRYDRAARRVDVLRSRASPTRTAWRCGVDLPLGRAPKAMPPGCGNDGGGHTVDLEMNGGGREAASGSSPSSPSSPPSLPDASDYARAGAQCPPVVVPAVSAVDEACATSATGPLGLPARISGSPSSPTLVGSSSIHG